jgi:hypothetical protein
VSTGSPVLIRSPANSNRTRALDATPCPALVSLRHCFASSRMGGGVGIFTTPALLTDSAGLDFFSKWPRTGQLACTGACNVSQSTDANSFQVKQTHHLRVCKPFCND